MADPNEDRPFNDQPSSGPDSEPKLRPPWQVVEEVEPEKTEEEAGPPPPTEPVPTEEEVKKEEIDLTGALEEEAPATEEVPVPETKMPPMEAALEEGPPEEMPPGEAPPEAPPIDAVRPLEEEAPPLEEAPTVEPPTPAPSGPLRAFHIETKSPLGPIKKLLPIILGLVLVVGLVLLFIQVGLPRLRLGVPSLPIPGGREVTLTYWGLWEPELVMKEIIADWNKDYPKIKVNYSMQSKQQYRERIQSALARGEGPDIFRYHVTWVPMLKSQLDSLPTEVMSASEFGVTYYPVASTNLRSGASYLGIPLGIDTLALLYNKDIFQTAGEAPPATWDELRNLAVELTTYDEAGRIQTAGVALGTTNNVEHWSDILGLMMLQNEADLTNPVGALAEDALEYYTIFNRKDRVWDQTLPNSTLAFANGKLAMYFGYSWDVFEIKKINPDLNFGIVKAPQVPGTQNISWASFWVEGVNNKSEHKKEAWQFLEYLSSKETLVKLYQAESRVRLFGEPYPLVEMATQAKTDPLVAPFIEQAPYAKTWYLCSRTDDNGINDRMISYFKDAVNAVNANEDPARALNTTASGVAQLLSQYGVATMIVR